ncbi:MAG TPA: aldo/keto reductase [Bacteroidales bacterium]|nr:aldo/keto reductase [Bacteroidales bacterium]
MGITNRRNFLRNSALGLFGLPVAANTGLNMGPGSEKTAIKRYKMLGRTGFKVSDFGSGAPSSEAVLRALLDAGVNVIDTGEAYGNGNNEKLIAKAIKDYDRSKLFINSKLYAEKDFGSKKDVVERCYASIERLETDYIDCMMIHSAENSRIIKDKSFHAAMKKLKKEGKVRYVGVSCHGNNHLVNPEESLEKILMTAVDDSRFDVIQMAYNFFNAGMAGKVLEACEKHNIGTQIIKSNPVQLYLMMDDRIQTSKAAGKEVPESTQKFYDKFKAMTEEGKSFFKDYGIINEEELMEAAMTFVLSDKRAHSVLWAFNSFTDIEVMLKMSGSELEDKNMALLANYDESFGRLNCRIGCSACEVVCPHKMPVGYIMRYNYYFNVKGRQREAMEKFATLPGKKPHEVCGNCEGHCEGACPYQVSTRSVLAAAERNLGGLV